MRFAEPFVRFCFYGSVVLYREYKMSTALHEALLAQKQLPRFCHIFEPLYTYQGADFIWAGLLRIMHHIIRNTTKHAYIHSQLSFSLGTPQCFILTAFHRGARQIMLCTRKCRCAVCRVPFEHVPVQQLNSRYGCKRVPRRYRLANTA